MNKLKAITKGIDLAIPGLLTDYNSLEDRYFQAFKAAHGNLSMTIEEFRGSNIYNVFNACILIDMVNNQFLSNFIPEIVDNSISQNEIQTIKYSGNTSFFLIHQLKKLDNIEDAQIIDINNDPVSTLKGQIRIFIKRVDSSLELDANIIGNTIYDVLTPGCVLLGDHEIIINKNGFNKSIQWSYANEISISLSVIASVNFSWNGAMISNNQLVNMLLQEWNNYYQFNKLIQPLVFIRNLQMLGNITFEINYNGAQAEDFIVQNGDYLLLDEANISLQVG
ncbi:MAG: hypothetical protein FWE18_00215 [Alphaproteobacteria bacterium]|nr:hypothetical protein [Alphaproteobacteria bacterium]